MTDTAGTFRSGLLAAIPDGEYVPSVVAQKYVALLAETDPALLDAWLHDHAAAFATDLLVRLERHTRSAARARAASRDFADNATDADWIGSFAVSYCIGPDNTRLRVADMTGVHHRFVATEYEVSAKTDRMLAAFHRAIAKKVGQQRTADVIGEAEYDALYRSIVRAPAVGAA